MARMFYSPNYHEKIGFIKDIAAGAVFFAAMTAIAIGLMIYVPKLTVKYRNSEGKF